MSHQLVEFEENVSGVYECNFNVMKKFSDVYDGDNGIYLYDCFGDKRVFQQPVEAHGHDVQGPTRGQRRRGGTNRKDYQ
jgi:hypothetical protein